MNDRRIKNFLTVNTGIVSLFVNRTVYVVEPCGIIIYAKRGMPPDKEIVSAIPAKPCDDSAR